MGDGSAWLCYACTSPSSTAPIANYCCRPETQDVFFHAPCFVQFAGWLETRKNLGDILSAWARSAHYGRCCRVKRVLHIVRRWQRSNWLEWAQTLHARSCCRSVFDMWVRTAVGPPELVDSSPEEFNVPPPERSDSSSGYDADFFEELMSVLPNRDIPHSRPANEHQQGHWCYS